MSSMEKNPSELQKPAGASMPADEPAIHTIPQKFYGVALKKSVRDVPVPPPVPPVVPPPPVPPPVPPAPAKPKRKKSRGVIIGAGVATAILLALGAYIIFSPKKSKVAVNAASVCGDRKCDAATETPFSCSADCGPPPAVCGDKKCDVTESAQSCPVDCAPPVVCGDNTCAASETIESCPADCKPPEPKPGQDSDSDGLSDREETEVFGTSSNDPNTDKDSFIDLNEVLNLFDPAKPTPAMLKDNSHIALYLNVAQHFVIFRPAAWIANDATDPEKKQVTFTAPSGETVEVLAQDKQPAQSLMDWYLLQAPGVTSSQIEPLTFKTRQGYDAMLSPDQMSAYVDFGNKTIVVRYNLAGQLEIQYRSTFKMMVHSLKKL